MHIPLISLLVALSCVAPSATAQRAPARAKIAPAPSIVDDTPAALLGATLPTGFVSEAVGSFNNATVVTFHDSGRVFVAEKAGRVLTAEQAGSPFTLVVDITEEVANWADHGLVGVEADPDYDVNGYIYLYYAVDHHHLMNFGLPSYDPAVSADFIDTIARITRYTLNSSGQVIPGSRTVLVGESASTGIPLCSDSHGVGALHFGNDGTLLVTTGDGHAGTASATCFSDGIITPKENILQFRAQLVDSLSGKLLRLDPATGDGVPSNPFYDAQSPRAAQSRVFAMGLRQPFRFQVREGTGSTNPADGLPGSVYVSDVGQSKWEELNIVTSGGTNFGWPIWEGITINFGGLLFLNPNLDAPNPLFGQTIPGIGLCENAYFNIQDFIVNASLNTPMYVNPCDPSQPVTSSEEFHIHEPPVIEWSHQVGARVPTFDVLGELTTIDIGSPESPIAGDPFEGNCASENLWYPGTVYPREYQNRVFVADFARGWLRLLDFDANDELLGVELFADPVGRIVSMAYNPLEELIYTLTLSDTGISTLNRLDYVGLDSPPIAALDAPPQPWGDGPLYFTFDGSESIDPEGLDLSYSWDFGDGTPTSRQARTTHVFPSTDVSALGTTIARIFQLMPPESMTTTSSKSPEVIRDGDVPAQGTTDTTRQYDTFHHNGNFIPDKNNIDWIGYEFAQPQQFVSVIFTEGTTFSGLGGWWNQVQVQVRQNGQWKNVTDINESVPMYPGEFFPSFEQFEFLFEPTVGDAIRLFGIPGGNLDFVTVGELRVLALTEPTVDTPTNYTVTLTVTDPLGGSSTKQTEVFLENTPPAIEIKSPLQFETYSTTSPQEFTLRASRFDAEATPGSLHCEWQVLLHHNDHVHPGPIDTSCLTEATLVTDGCDGDIHFQEVRLTVSDPQGLSRTRSVFLTPDCDRNMNGIDDALDIANGSSEDNNLDGIPDELSLDCDQNGLPDLLEIFFGTARDTNNDGILDACLTLEGDGPKLGNKAPTSLTPPP